MDSITRREMLGGVAGAGVLVAVGAGGKLAYASDDTQFLRPPGGQDESRFIATCIRCNRCLTVCPTEAISLANLDDGLVNARTPYMDFKQGSCTFCEGDYLCVANCPTHALEPFDYEVDRIGLAVVDTSMCIAFSAQGGCHACLDDVCPYDAIIADDDNRPVVVDDLCNGCGICETICPSNVYRDFSEDGKRGINVEICTEARS